MAIGKDSKFYYPPNKPKEEKITFQNERHTDRENKIRTNYDNDIDVAERSRNNQYLDTSPKLEKEGFLGMDDLDRLRRRKISKIF